LLIALGPREASCPFLLAELQRFAQGCIVC